MALGAGTVTDGRFGDYAGAAADPDGTHRWVIQEYGTGGSGAYDWRTSIIRK